MSMPEYNATESRVAHFNAVACAELVASWARVGVRHAVMAPGSRSAPLAVALARCPAIAATVVLDERAAGFMALGIAMSTGNPVVVVCTSGTAGTHLHAPVVEAFHARLPLIVCTADRPPELQGIGAPQTIDQRALFGTAVRWYDAPGPPDDHLNVDECAVAFREVAEQTAKAACGRPNGPVHLNLAFREPLLLASAARPEPRDDSDDDLGADGADGSSSLVSLASVGSDDESIATLARAVAQHSRGLLVIGWGADVDTAVIARFAAATGWPVLADSISNGRVADSTITHYEALLRCEQWANEHRPDFVLRLGAAPTSKTLTKWLDASVPQALIDRDGLWADPERAVALRVHGDPDVVLAAVSDVAEQSAPILETVRWNAAWQDANALACGAIDAVLDNEPMPTEPRVARDVVSELRDGTNVLVASSMPVRDAEWFVAARSGIHWFANRGANGIDGLVSTAVGIAKGSARPTVALLGDLAFLHDAGGLLNAKATGVALTFVVIDNAGGGIFSFLPQHALCDHDEFEHLFGTPQQVNVAAVVEGYGLSVIEVDRAEALGEVVNRSLAVGGTRVVLIRTNRAANVDVHRRCWVAAHDALTN